MGASSSSSGRGGENRCQALVRLDEEGAEKGKVHHKSDFVDPCSLVDHLQPGDLVQKKGGFFTHNLLYSHFALYIGNGDIVHVTKRDGECRVRRDDLVDAFSGNLVRKANILDEHMKPREAPKIVLRARGQVNKAWNYNLLTNNCEHFATECRYGEKRSLQALGIGDVWNGRVTKVEYMFHLFRSVKERFDTFFNWTKRHVLGAVGMIMSGPSRAAISW